MNDDTGTETPGTENPSWHTMGFDEVIRDQNTSPDGLSASEAAQRLIKYGPNKISEEKPITAWKILLRQLMSFFNYVL